MSPQTTPHVITTKYGWVVTNISPEDPDEEILLRMTDDQMLVPILTPERIEPISPETLNLARNAVRATIIPKVLPEGPEGSLGALPHMIHVTEPDIVHKIGSDHRKTFVIETTITGIGINAAERTSSLLLAIDEIIEVAFEELAANQFRFSCTVQADTDLYARHIVSCQLSAYTLARTILRKN